MQEQARPVRRTQRTRSGAISSLGAMVDVVPDDLL
jgi:hypothetical protein